MITLRKLSSLSEGTRRRKLVILLRDFERDVRLGNDISTSYFRGIMDLISMDPFFSDSVRRKSRLMLESFSDADLLLRNLNALRHEILGALGRDWADWDLEAAPDADMDGEVGTTFPIRVYLEGLRSPFNAGSIMRTALAFGVERLWFSPEGTSPDHRRAVRSSMGAADRLKWDIVELEELPESVTDTVFALELGGEDISTFRFPPSGTVIIGSEELGVSPSALRRAESDGGVVSIPLPGPKTSLNVGVAFGILLRQWVDSLD